MATVSISPLRHSVIFSTCAFIHNFTACISVNHIFHLWITGLTVTQIPAKYKCIQPCYKEKDHLVPFTQN